MKQKLYFLLLVFSICFLSNAQVLDQSNWVTSTGTNLAIEQSSNQGILGQSYTADVAGTLNQIKLDLNILSAGTTLDFSIYEGSGNSGTLLGTLPLTFVSSSFGEYTVDVSSLNITITQGSMYTIVLSNASSLLSWVYTSSNSYANGEAYLSSNGGSFSTAALENVDFRFKTYVTPTVTPVAASNLSFDGIDDYVVLPNQNDFNFSSNAFTLEFWFKLADYTNISTNQTFLSKGNAWNVSIVPSGKIIFQVSWAGVVSTSTIEDNDWHHCAVVFNNSDFKLFLDGVLEKNPYYGGLSLPSNFISVALGENLEDTNRLFNGSLDDVRIWNIARTNSQIQGAFSCELNGNETGLMAYYKFNTGNDGLNNNDILALNDNSTNNYNGTFTNFALNGLTSNFRSNSILTSGVTIPAAPVAQAQIECLLTGADLTPVPSETVKWYYSPFSSATLDENTTLYNGTLYYAVVNANGCESEKTEVQIDIFDAPQVTSPIAYQINASASPLTAISDGTGLLWYTSMTGGVGSTTAPTPSTSALGSTVYWVASTNNNGCESINRASIEVFVTPPPPANDDCSGGVALTVGTTQTSNAVTVNLGGATNSSTAPEPDCGGYEGGDVWYTTIVPASGNLVVKTFGTNPNDDWNTVLEVYNGDCNNLQYIDCNNDDSNSDFSKLQLSGLTPSETIYIRVFENYTSYSNATFQISAYELLPPANDECLGGTMLTVGTNRASNAVTVNLGGATDSSSAPSPNCSGYNGGDTWYTAVVPASGNLTVETFGFNTEDYLDSVIELYIGDCNNLTYLDCADGGGDNGFSKLELSDLTPGETISIRVWEYSQNFGGGEGEGGFPVVVKSGNTTKKTTSNQAYNESFSEAIFQISVYELIPPANDECTGGIALTVGTTRTSNAETVNLEGATYSYSAPTPDCDGSDVADVWYTTVIPASGYLTVETFGLNTNDDWDTVIEVYTGDCNNLTYVDCADYGGDNGFSKLELSGLTPNEVLYIRAWEYGEVPSNAMFKIAVYDATNSPHAIRINDYEETLTIDHNALFDLTNEITVESYVKLIDYESYAPIVFKAEDESFDNGWLLELEDEKVVFYPHGYSNLGVTSATNLELHTTYHIAATYDGTTAKIYINGVLDASETLTLGNITNNTYPVVIGSDAVSYYAAAEIDLVKIWNIVRTESEIQSTMNTCIPSGTSGLIAQYDFEEAPLSTTFIDNSGNNLNGTYSNMEYFDWTFGTTCGTLSVSKTRIENDIKLYPNPVNDNLYIEVKALTNVSVQVLDINGRQITEKKLVGSKNMLDTSKLQSGIYLINIKSDQGRITKKLVKN
ncbi:LamG-like jellyroll fold domain-containing protein [Mariniflexile jejuense]|uniref:LamG-like jellyroll fold domain-containing protein n=1 Tax=Mariniflexile jejuense TaxID=1173582 RepID=A0ABW3JGB2_9FLAO